MKKATRKALMKSIVHWREYLVKSIGGELVYPSALECALCVKFNNSETLADPCIGCPVCQCTGKTLCRATAYYAVTDAKTPQDQQFPIAAMLQFLTDLLPEKVKSTEFPWEEQDMHTNLNGYSPCPVCDGDGLEAVEVFKSQSFSRDTGEPYEELRHCETCDGSGEVMLEDECRETRSERL